MVELIIGFLFGFFLSYVRIIKTHVYLRTADRILKWDQECLGWRPVVTRDELIPGKTYLAAFELNNIPAEKE